MKKESLQIVRDPSCLLVAFVLPLILLLVYGYGMSLELNNIRVAAVLEDNGPLAQSLVQTFEASRYLKVLRRATRKAAEDDLTNARVRAVIILANDFSKNVESGRGGSIQLITDGSEANSATIIENYVQGIVAIWQRHQAEDRHQIPSESGTIRTRFWYNDELDSRFSLVPGSIVLVLAIIGTLLTALVVAREWERGTMEAMLATPIRKSDLFIGKLFPYYLLGIGSTMVCVIISRVLFGVPLRGSLEALLAIVSVFLFAALIQGFFISTVTKNQFLASVAALVLSFLPNFILSGLIFEIDSMPRWIQMFTYCFPARYCVASLRTVFLVGDVWPLFTRHMTAVAVIGIFFLMLAVHVTPRRLE